MLSAKKSRGRLRGSEEYGDEKKFSRRSSKTSPFLWLQDFSYKSIAPSMSLQGSISKKDEDWFKRNVLDPNTLENMFENMTQRAGIQPYFTKHFLRAMTVTFVSSVNVEARQIKAVTGHKSDASIQSNSEYFHKSFTRKLQSKRTWYSPTSC